MFAHRLKGIFFVLFGSLLLAGCLRYEGDVAVDATGALTGSLEFGIEKSIAPLLGVNSVDDLRSAAAEGNTNAFCSPATADIRDAGNEYVISCTFSEAQSGPENDLYAVRQGDQVIFRFTYNEDSEGSATPDQEYGTVRIAVNMPGPIVSVDDKGRGHVSQQGSSAFTVSGKASQVYDITVVASCSDGCTEQASSSDLVPSTAGFVKAKDSVGGVVTKDTVFKARKTPYLVKKTIQIPENVTVVVEPGTTLEWRGSKKKTSMFQNSGKLFIEGTKAKPIVLAGAPRGYFNTKGATQGTRTSVRFAILNGGGSISGHLGGGGPGDGGDFSLRIADSLMRNIENAWYVSRPRGSLVFERNHLIDSAGFSIGGSEEPTSEIVIRDNVFRGPAVSVGGGRTKAWIHVWAGDGNRVKIIGNDFSQTRGTVLIDATPAINAGVNASGNYWGTTDSSKIAKMIKDGADWFPARPNADVSNPLKKRPSSIPTIPKSWSRLLFTN